MFLVISQSQGDTLENIQDNSKEAIELYLSSLPQSEKEEIFKQKIKTMIVEVKVA